MVFAAATTAFRHQSVLVVMGGIGILVALVLPAVQAAREAARGAQCQKQTHRW